MGWKKQATGRVLILTYLLFLLDVNVVVCLQHLTTVQLLPPGSQFDSCLLTGCSVRFITGTTQRYTIWLSTQVKQAVTEGQTRTYILSMNRLPTHRTTLSCTGTIWKRGGILKLHSTHWDYSLLVGLGWQGGVASSKWSFGVRQCSTLS